MPDFQNGQIYRLVCNGSDMMYYGSTTQQLSKYFAETRRQYKAWKSESQAQHDKTKYKLFEEVGVENVKIIWIENFPCNSKKELEARERVFIEGNDCVNKNRIPTRTKKEYYEANKDTILFKNKRWDEENKEKVVEYQKQYREEHRDKIKEQQNEYRQKNLERLREYDRARSLEKTRKYVEKNREKVNARKRELYALKKQAKSEN